MSSTKKKTTTRTSRITSTMHVDTDDSADVSSPLSPWRMSRQQEKEQLSHLNDRLAGYIDRVRQLEAENARLTVQIRDVEIVEKRERNNVRAAFEAELSDTRKLLDDTAKQKAKIQIDADKARGEFDDLKTKIGKLEKELKSSETARLNADSLVQDLQARVNTAENRRKHAEDEAKRLRQENEALDRQLQTARRQLEEETLLRVDLENRLQSLKEELQFNRHLHEKELEETRRKRQIEMTTVSRELETEYQAKLQEQLRQMRGEFDAKIARNRMEVEELYSQKLHDTQDHAERSRQAAAEAREEMTMWRAKFHDVEKSGQDHQAIVDGLNKKIKDLEAQLRFIRDDYTQRLLTRDEDINKLREEIQRMLVEYQDLMDTKVQLDVELQAYQKLLESEESRLRLTPSPSPVGRGKGGASVSFAEVTESPSRRGVKRKRVLQESDELTTQQTTYKTMSNATGDVQVIEHDTDGKFIRIHNAGQDEIALGGWHLKSVSNGKEVSYKFHSRQSLKPDKTLTVWSANSGQTHSPPSDLVMKNQDWPTGNDIRSFLLDADQTEVAWRESKRSIGSFTAAIDGAEEADQRCAIM